MKRGLSDAFRHAPVAELDHWPLGFYWGGIFYIGHFLPLAYTRRPSCLIYSQERCTRFW